MNTKKLVRWIELILFAIILAFFVPIIFEWVQTGSLEITSAGIKEALFIGILVPVLLLLSKNIKNDYFFVLLAIVLILVIAYFTRVVILI